MNAQQFQEWIGNAFLFVEAALATEIATISRTFLNEEYVRSALAKGLILTNTGEAYRVATEEDAVWSGNSCFANAASLPAGRPIQHDVAVRPDPAKDAGMVCEVKWLKQPKPLEVAIDIWKLALSRGTTPELGAMRTYLLLGGTQDALSSTLGTLRANHFNLRWSPQGRATVKPAPTTLQLNRALAGAAKSSGRKGWEKLISFGKHFRSCPPTWSSLRASLRQRWLRTVGQCSWRAVLWELDHWGVKDASQIQWNVIQATLNHQC